MLMETTELKGYAIAATDGLIGTVNDFLFDDRTWKLRWLVVDTGVWLSGRKVLLHPSAIGQPDHATEQLAVNLTQEQVRGSPDLAQDQPVSQQLENHLYEYYGWDPMWGGAGYFGAGGTMFPMDTAPYFGGTAARAAHEVESHAPEGDPNLRSTDEVTGYDIQARDGAIGHVENILIDDASWTIRYLLVDTRNWLPGEHVLASPYAVRKIDWASHQIHLDLTCDQVKAGPPWDAQLPIDQDYEKRLHGHYGWPGYGW